MSLDERPTSRRFRSQAVLRSTADLGPVRRIVTGLDSVGRATIQSDGVPPRVYTTPENGPTIYEIWHTEPGSVATSASAEDARQEPLRLSPPKGGTRIQVLDILPEGLGHQAFCANESIDYCIVLRGEMTLILDETETVVRAGDIVVQRGTRHAWANRSGRLCRVAFILVDATLDPGR